MIKKIRFILIVFLSVLTFAFISNDTVSAKEVVAKDSIVDIAGETIGTIEIYDDSEIRIAYKYGLRMANLHYCKEGLECEMSLYNYLNIAEASIDNPYKNTKSDLAIYRYKPILEKGQKYGFRVEAYFGTSSRYTGSENLASTFMLYYLKVDTENVYVKGSDNPSFGDEGLNNMMSDLAEITNVFVLPIIYIATGLILVIKGALLGIDIVKNADNPETRAQKIRALIWLVVGVGISLTASTLIGVLTGFFDGFF